MPKLDPNAIPTLSEALSLFNEGGYTFSQLTLNAHALGRLVIPRPGVYTGELMAGITGVGNNRERAASLLGHSFADQGLILATANPSDALLAVALGGDKHDPLDPREDEGYTLRHTIPSVDEDVASKLRQGGQEVIGHALFVNKTLFRDYPGIPGQYFAPGSELIVPVGVAPIRRDDVSDLFTRGLVDLVKPTQQPR